MQIGQYAEKHSVKPALLMAGSGAAVNWHPGNLGADEAAYIVRDCGATAFVNRYREASR